MAWALAYLGTLGAVCFALWMRQKLMLDIGSEMLAALESRVTALEARPSPADDLADLRATVSTLSLRAGLEPNRKTHPPKG